MSRIRTKDKNLPPRMHRKGNSYYYVARENGKNKWIALGNDLSQARLKWAELENIALRDEDAVTFAVAATRFRRDVLPGKAPKTQEEYSRQLIRLVAVFGNVVLDHITPQHVRQYLDARSAKTAANREKALMSTVINHAREWGYMRGANPCAGVRGYREDGRDRYVEDKELLAVLSVACQPLRDAIELAYYTGQRPSDILKITRNDIRDGAIHLRQRKTGTPLRIAVTGALQELVERLLVSGKQLSPYLVRNEAGQGLTYLNLRYRFTLARKAAGVPDFQFRDIRAKAATDTEEASGLGHAQRLLGHKNRAMTEHYVRDRIGLLVEPTPKNIT